MSLQLATSFLRALGSLTPKEQAAALATVTAYNSDPSQPGLSLHRVDRARDERLWTARVNRDLRVVLLRDGATVSFLFIAHHDKAYRWAQRRRMELHPVTGAPQIVEIEEVVRAAESAAPSGASGAQFANEHDDYLLSLGVPPVWLATVRQVDEDGLDEILHRLPLEAAEALIELSGGSRPQAGTARPTDDLEQAFHHPDAKRSFWVVTDEDALRAVLERPWVEWAIFLHPSQRSAVEGNFRGPARAFGAAGTGKTVVALHRIAWLAARSSGGRLLLTTFSRTLAQRLSRDLYMLMDPSLPARERIEVVHLHKLAHSLVEEAESAPRIVAETELDELIAAAAGASAAERAFLRGEWDAVIDYWGLRDWPEYRDADRRGRGRALSRGARAEVWDIAVRLRALLEERGLCTWGDMVDRARAIVEARPVPPFRHVVADEAQDFGPREMRLLRALTTHGPRDLFLTGDVGQRIYRWPFAWSAVGIDVRGRSVRLKVNYRTTRQIKGFADRLLPEEIVDIDDRAAERGAISLLSGPVPELHRCADAAAEAGILRQWLRRMLDGGVTPAEIALLGRTRRTIAARAAPVLAELGLATGQLDDDPAGDAVALGTMHRAKGLEFRAVALIGCELARPTGVEGGSDRAAERRERHLLYVACTRARDALLITAVGELPPAVAGLSPRSP